MTQRNSKTKCAAKRKGKSSVDLKKREPSTKQKTVRVPVALLSWLEKEAARVPISVPSAIVQILEKAYTESNRK